MITQLLDARNQHLWDQINKEYIVNFTNSSNNEYGCFTENKNVTFYINKNNLCIDSFTHEMLHVYLRLKECYIGSSLEMTIRSSNILSRCISTSLIEHMGNCLDHVKMLPIYLDLQFDRKKFILDYDVYKCSPEELASLKKYYKQGKTTNLQAVDAYIGRLVSIFADPNDTFDYSKNLMQLKNIDPYLYQIIEKLFSHWKEIKLENRAIFEDDYHTVTFNFKENMKKWLTRNQIN
ncbi:hypothetical protein FMM05_13295 [Flavobacterium zepuense]|uniref:Uncharacterized protein n=1 Tax=Flavobacterium zepuense TaxID=2593302 RepID=A0A552UZM7_9FLAO|nr:hypothetical protein [Flavobacterium zepuense]TRW23630.1 hypothetical protein FMM05_13295 [Flavobacterium zepuense]